MARGESWRHDLPLLDRITSGFSIRVHNDQERNNLLQLFEDKGYKWMEGQDPTDFIPSHSYPFYIGSRYNFKIGLGEPSGGIKLTFKEGLQRIGGKFD